MSTAMSTAMIFFIVLGAGLYNSFLALTPGAAGTVELRRQPGLQPVDHRADR
jgi:hypothetical protein